MIAVLFAAAIAAAIAAAVVWARRRFLVATVRGQSMEPTLRNGDRVWVRRLPASRLRTGQIVLVERPPLPAAVEVRADGRLVPEAGHWPEGTKLPGDRWLVKRIASVGGDPAPDVLSDTTASPGRVPIGHVVVLGDNPGHSYDSRRFGYLPDSAVAGVVVGHLRPART
jgi:signal peptidase I